jgi:hypothetical protein
MGRSVCERRDAKGVFSERSALSSAKKELNMQNVMPLKLFLVFISLETTPV